MADWDKIKSRGKVLDRRGAGPLVGGIGIGGLALMLLANFLLGGDPGDVLGQLDNIQIETQTDTGEFEGEDSYEVFASQVLGSNNSMWENAFDRLGQTYDEPVLVLFRGATESSCGTATSRVGPHYCPINETIYLDETFFDELESRFGAEGGDVAEAYVIAHEAGHHAQNELGVMGEVQNAQRQNPNSANDYSIALELQADCFAGLWANSIRDMGVLAPGEIKEAMDAAASVGDDNIQERTTGYVNSENWNHGSSEQRVSWFMKGYETGNLSSCEIDI